MLCASTKNEKPAENCLHCTYIRTYFYFSNKQNRNLNVNLKKQKKTKTNITLFILPHRAEQKECEQKLLKCKKKKEKKKNIHTQRKPNIKFEHTTAIVEYENPDNLKLIYIQKKMYSYNKTIISFALYAGVNDDDMIMA